jgi:hypothetical protein
MTIRRRSPLLAMWPPIGDVMPDSFWRYQLLEILKQVRAVILKAFVAQLPSFRDAPPTTLRTQRSLSNAVDPVRLWIDTAQEFGVPVPEPKGRRLMLAKRPPHQFQ